MAGFRLTKKVLDDQGEAALGGVVTESGSQETVGGEGAPPLLRRLPLVVRGPERAAIRGTVRLTLAVPRQLHTRLKLAAVRQERSIVSLVSGWIEERTSAV